MADIHNKIKYRNDTGKVLRRRGGEEIRPLGEFWTAEYEPNELGLTILEDNTSPIIGIMEFGVSLTPQQVMLPSPTHSSCVETTIQAVSDGARINVGFNRSADATAPVDFYTSFSERIDTRRVYCLWISGSGTVRIIFKEVTAR